MMDARGKPAHDDRVSQIDKFVGVFSTRDGPVKARSTPIKDAQALQLVMQDARNDQLLRPDSF
jgi:hypothetical protein